MNSIILKNDTSLVGAHNRESNFPIDCYDDSDGPLWLFGHEFGTTMVIRARSFEAAWEIAIDEAKTIADDEVPEAYGFYGDSADEELRMAGERAEETGDYPELVDGYYMQSNCSGTGIVDIGHYAWLREMTHDDADGIRLVVRHQDDADELPRVRFQLDSYSFIMAVTNSVGSSLGKAKSFRSFDLCADVGERIRRLERAFGAVHVEREWAQD